jgi:ribosomal protein S12 methylthiotransferase accessory factor
MCAGLHAGIHQTDTTMITDIPIGLERLERLVAPMAGLVSRTISHPTPATAAYFPVSVASLGNLAYVAPSVAEATGGRDVFGSIDGAGSGLTVRRARLVAVAEALERYSSAVFCPDQLLWATADELADEAMDLDLLPRCSPTELAHPRCPVLAPRKEIPQRWVRGWSLTRNRPIWIPAVLTWLYFKARTDGERFTNPISTGCAAHSDLSAAIIGGICEVVERDAISLTWLQQLRLPEIVVDDLTDDQAIYLERSRRAGRSIRFFDATTNIGLATIYAVETFGYADRIAQMVSCSTELDPGTAIAKICRESASSYSALRSMPAAPESLDDLVSVSHGGVYMGHPSRRRAFDFLLDSDRETRPLSLLPKFGNGSSRATLDVLLDMFRSLDIDIFCVDITTDEARSVDFHVVRVIVPQLMPLSFTYRARYLAHRRLYEGPPRFGHPAAAEFDLNPWPQPFA